MYGSPMTNPIPRIPVLAALVPLVVSLALTSGCDAKKTQPAKAYEVTGIVKRLPTTNTSRQIYIHHQAIPDFITADGKAMGMQSMTMGFALPDGLDIAGITPETPVVFTFETHWDKRPALRITKLKKSDKPAKPAADPSDIEDHSGHDH